MLPLSFYLETTPVTREGAGISRSKKEVVVGGVRSTENTLSLENHITLEILGVEKKNFNFLTAFFFSESWRNAKFH